MSNKIKNSDPNIFEAARKGDFDFVRAKVEENRDLIKRTDENKRLLIHWACVGGNLKLVTYLVDLGSSINALDDTDTTPLILASSSGRYQVVCLLLERGAIDVIDNKSNSGHSALQYAASKGFVEICQKLLECGADINIADARGATPLHRAASKGNIKIVHLFVINEKIKVNVKDAYGNTPLHLACEEDRQDEAKLLVNNGASLDIKNSEQKTPLELCSPKLFRLLTQKD